MANEKVNKVIDRNGNVLIDLTNDTVSPNKVLQGTKFHGSDGKEYTGILPANELDTVKYNFIDYDGTLIYSFTDTEIDAMSELPAGPDHTDENLTFQEWNWDLEDLKAWDRTRPDRPIVGANLVTTDGKTYLTIVTRLSLTEGFDMGRINYSSSSPVIEVDWGDGSDVETITVNSSAKGITHTFSEYNTEYTIVITPISNADNLSFGGYENRGDNTDGRFLKSIQLGNVAALGSNKTNNSKITKINIPSTVKNFYQMSNMFNLESMVIPKDASYSSSYNNNAILFNKFYSLSTVSIPKSPTFAANLLELGDGVSIENIVIPNPESEYTLYSLCYENYAIKNFYVPEGCTRLGDSVFSNCRSLQSVILPNTITDIGTSCFSHCERLKNLIIPNSVQTIGGSAFNYCYSLDRLVIPDSVKSFTGSNHFSNIEGFTLDLSEQTKVITLGGGIGLRSTGIILVPQALLESYKSATYWSSYASQMVGV